MNGSAWYDCIWVFFKKNKGTISAFALSATLLVELLRFFGLHKALHLGWEQLIKGYQSDEVEDLESLLEEKLPASDVTPQQIQTLPDRQTEALHRISKRLYRIGEKPTFELVSADYALKVEETGKATVRRELGINVNEGTPLHFLEEDISADGDEAAVSTFEDIDYNVQDLGGCGADYLAVEDKSLKKRALLFFLPRIKSSENSVRTVASEFCWPDMMWRLPEEGADYYVFNPDWETDCIQQVRFSIKVSNALRYPEVRYVGPNIDGLDSPSVDLEDGYRRYEYSTRDIPADGSEYRFRVSGETET